MKRRISLLAGIPVLLLLVFGTLLGRNALAEGQAHNDMLRQLSLARHALQAEQNAGVERARLAPYRARLAAVTARSAPSSPAPWNDAQVSFYRTQSSQFRSIRRAVRRLYHAEIHAARVRAQQTLARARSDLRSAQSLDLDATAYRASIASHPAAEAVSCSLRACRALFAAGSRVTSALEQRIQSQRLAVARNLAAAQGNQSTLVQSAQATLAAIQNQLNLLTIFQPKSAAEGTRAALLAARVGSAPGVNAAAVKLADLQALATQVARTYAVSLPARLIVVSTEDQWATMYQNGTQVYSTPVTTGGPELPTDHGVFHIYFKASPFLFHSPWPPGSPYYYNPTLVQFWMPFDGGEGLHDASWRSNFGPGSNLAPTDLGTGNYILGTHGCVNLPFDAAQFAWNWAPVGTTVAVV